MSILGEIQELAITKRTPKLRAGQTVRVHQRIKEGEKERIQIFEGLILKLNSGHGADRTFTVRKIASGVGVEKTFPVYSTNIEKIEVKKKSKIRRAKLYYMRERFGKSARLKETFVSSNDADMMEGPEEEVEAVEEVFEEVEMEAPAGAALEANEESAAAEDEVKDGPETESDEQNAPEEANSKEEPAAEPEAPDETEEKTEEK